MSADQQLTPERLRAMKKEQIIHLYMVLVARLRRREDAFRDVVSERNRLAQQVTMLQQRTPHAQPAPEVTA